MTELLKADLIDGLRQNNYILRQIISGGVSKEDAYIYTRRYTENNKLIAAISQGNGSGKNAAQAQKEETAEGLLLAYGYLTTDRENRTDSEKAALKWIDQNSITTAELSAALLRIKDQEQKGTQIKNHLAYLTTALKRARQPQQAKGPQTKAEIQPKANGPQKAGKQATEPTLEDINKMLPGTWKRGRKK